MKEAVPTTKGVTGSTLGVTKGKGGQLEAHAWVESEGQIVIGGSDSPSRFAPLMSANNKEKYERDRGHILLG